MRNVFLASFSAILLAFMAETTPASGLNCQLQGAIITLIPYQNGYCSPPNDDEPAYFYTGAFSYCDGRDGGPWSPPPESGWPPPCGTAMPLNWNNCTNVCLPKDCEDEPADDNCNYVGDPVDLTSGYLLRKATDVDLGRGLHFTRFYASGANERRSVGWNWSHNLEWGANRNQPSQVGNNNDLFVVREPQELPRSYLKYRDTQEDAADSNSGGFVEDTGEPGSADFRFTSGNGTVVEFEHWYDQPGREHNHYMRPSSIKPPGEPAIQVTYDDVEKTRTYSNGESSLKIYLHTSGIFMDLVSHVVVNEGTVNEETLLYTYRSDNPIGRLWKVQIPDYSTANPGDTILTTYAYLGNEPRARLVREERTVGGVTTTVGEWDYQRVPERAYVTSANEKALDQSLTFSYSEEPGGELLQTTIEDSSSEELATITLDGGMIGAVAGSGGPGYELPFRNATTVEVNGLARWETKEDANGNITRYEDYDNRGNPGRVIEDWGGDDERGSEYTYHPFKNTPLTVTRESTLTGVMEARTSYDYDDGGETTSLLRKVTRSGNTLNESGQVIWVDYETSYTYDAEGRIKTISGPRPGMNFTEFKYEDPTTSHPTKIHRYVDVSTSKYLETTFSNFDERGNPRTVTDPNGNSTTFLYDGHDRITAVTPPYGGSESATISFSYDADGNLEKVDFPPDSEEQPYFLKMDYDDKGNLLYIADARDDAIVFEYEKSRRTREARYTGFTDYDNRGTLVGDAQFNYDHPDFPGQLFRAFNPLFGESVYTQYGYDGNGNNTTVVDENGKQDALIYDALDRLVNIQQVRGATYKTTIGYDSQSNLSLLTDPYTGETYSKASDYVTDDFGRLVKVVSPDTGTTFFVYDGAGNLTTKVEAVGVTNRTTQYTYDGLDRILTVDYPTDDGWVYTYDSQTGSNQKGRLASVTNGTVTTHLSYTPRGEVLIESTTISGGTYLSGYSYDAAGNLKSIDDPNRVKTYYLYAGARPKEIAVEGGGQTETIREISWLPVGPRKHAEFPPFDSGTGHNVVVSDRHPNLRGQVDEIDVIGPQGTVLDRSFTYHYSEGSPGPDDPGPNLDRVVDTRDPSQSRFYFYDELDRLSDAKLLSGAADEAFLYDASGNRTQWTAPGGTTGYEYEEETNRLSQATGAGARYYAHDAYGNRIYEGSSPYTGTPSLIYDEANRLIEVRDADSGFISLGTYRYDAFGRRVAKSSDSSYYFYDQAGRLLARREDDAGGDHLRSYVYAEDELVGFVDLVESPPGGCAGLPVVGGELGLPDFWWLTAPAAALFVLLVPALRRRPIAATGVVTIALVVGMAGVARSGIVSVAFFWVHTDHLGTPLAVTDTPANPANAKVVWRATYEAFGKATVDEDPDGDQVPVPLNVRFPGQYYDEESGLHYNFYRTYDPGTGRYLEADPLGQAGGLNVFAYVESDPANSADPEGLQALAPSIAIPNIPAPPAVVWVGVAGVAGYWAGTKIEPYVSPIIWPYLEKLADGSADESTDEPDECDDGPDCDASYASDVSVCRAIGKRSKMRGRTLLRISNESQGRVRERSTALRLAALDYLELTGKPLWNRKTPSARKAVLYCAFTERARERFAW